MLLCVTQQCLQLDADDRPTSSVLLRHEFFTRNGFAHRFGLELKLLIQREMLENPLLLAAERASASEVVSSLAEETRERESREREREQQREKENREQQQRERENRERELANKKKAQKVSEWI